MRSDDALTSQTQLDTLAIASRIRIFRDPELQPAAHARLIEMFNELGIPLNVGCSGTTPAQIQWMVKAGYGLALMDQNSPIESGLTTRPLAGVSWTADTAFVHHSRSGHIALPFIERSLCRNWKDSKRKQRLSDGVKPEQLKLLA